MKKKILKIELTAILIALLYHKTVFADVIDPGFKGSMRIRTIFELLTFILPFISGIIVLFLFISSIDYFALKSWENKRDEYDVEEETVIRQLNRKKIILKRLTITTIVLIVINVVLRVALKFY